MSDFYFHYHRDFDLSGDAFAGLFVDGVWNIYDKIWAVRCKLINDPGDLQSLTNVDLNKQFKMNDKDPRRCLGTGDTHLLPEPLSTILMKLARQKRLWLSVISHCAQIQREEGRNTFDVW